MPFHDQLLLNSDRVTEASRVNVNFVSRSCDLAGSERVKKTKAEGERLQEAQSINSSLLELGYVEKMQCLKYDSAEPGLRSCHGPDNGLFRDCGVITTRCIKPTFTIHQFPSS